MTIRPLMRRFAALAALAVVVLLGYVLPGRAPTPPTTEALSTAADPTTTSAPTTPGPSSGPTQTPGPQRTADQQPTRSWTPEAERVFTRDVAKEPSSGLRVTGRDGYLFLGDLANANLSQALGRRSYSAAEVTQVGAVLSAQQAWLARRGIVLAVLVAPAKWEIYDDKLPEWADGLRGPRIYDQLLAAYPTVPWVDVRPALRSARAAGAAPYSRLNSHWSDHGGYLATSELYRALLGRDPQLGPLSLPAVSSVSVADANNEFAQLVGAPGPNDWARPVLEPALPAYRTFAATEGSRTGTIDMQEMPIRTAAAAANPHRLLVLGDSMTTALTPYLATSFASTLMMRHWLDEPDKTPSLAAAVQQFRPDVVLYVITERNLNRPMADAQVWEAATALDQALPASPDDTAAAAYAAPVRDVALGQQPVVVHPVRGSGASVLVRLSTTSTGPAVLTLSGGGASVAVRVPPGQGLGWARLPWPGEPGVAVRASAPGAVTLRGVQIVPLG